MFRNSFKVEKYPYNRKHGFYERSNNSQQSPHYVLGRARTTLLCPGAKQLISVADDTI